jgi:P4 family phage/plasmid primase-like protien
MPTLRKKIFDIFADSRAYSAFHTHVGMVELLGRFYFNREKIEDMWKTYNKGISKGVENMGFAEKSGAYIPLICDIDIAVLKSLEPPACMYTPEQLETIVSMYQSVIRETLNNVTDKDLFCLVLEKDSYEKTKANGDVLVKRGFHLHFPFIFVHKINYEIHIIPRIKKLLRDVNIFENLHIDDSSTVIDKGCCSVPWLMYGSVKGKGMKPYLVTCAYDANMKKVKYTKVLANYKLYDINEKAIPLKGKVTYNLPRILSIHPASRKIFDVKPGILAEMDVTETLKKKDTGPPRINIKLSVKQALKEASILVPMLSAERSSDQRSWMDIGWALYNITQGSVEGLGLWKEFSKKCPDKYDELVCIYEWDNMVMKSITLGTLKFYARIDNPNAYEEYKLKEAKKHVNLAIDGSHHDIAKILYNMYGDYFVCSNIEGKVWYYYDKHRWKRMNSGVYLRNKISDEIVSLFIEKSRSVFDQMKGADNDTVAVLKKKVGAITKVIERCGNHNFKMGIMAEAMDIFYDENFSDNLDSNPELIGIENGVIECLHDRNIIRDGKPEDYISKAMPVTFEEFDPDDPLVKEIEDFWLKIFPDPELRRYFLDITSEVFVGGNNRKILPMWLGDGDNGKSVTQVFFEKMLGGDYAIKIPTTVLTSKKPMSGSAWADLARAGGGVRWAVVEEPDEKEEMNTGITKSLTGNDSILARDLYQKGSECKEYTPMFKLQFIGNLLPAAKGDKAYWARTRVVPFESAFCDDPNEVPDTLEEQIKQKIFLKDGEFTKKIPELLPAMLWYLLRHRLKPKMKGTPKKVLAAVESYKMTNDTYRQYTEECVLEQDEAKISITELYTSFKEWYRESLPGCKVPIKNVVTNHFSKLWGPTISGKIWLGKRLRTLDDELKDGSAIILSEKEEKPDMSSVIDSGMVVVDIPM